MPIKISAKGAVPPLKLWRHAESTATLIPMVIKNEGRFRTETAFFA